MLTNSSFKPPKSQVLVGYSETTLSKQLKEKLNSLILSVCLSCFATSLNYFSGLNVGTLTNISVIFYGGIMIGFTNL